MIRTFTRTTFTENLEEADVTLYIYNHCKYNALANEETKVVYKGVTSWDIIEGGVEADNIEQNGLIDDNHEYIILHFNNGNTATFRCSYVDMFIR